MPCLLMFENKLEDFEVRLEALADKLEFFLEDIVVQLQEVKEILHKERFTMDTTQDWMDKKDDPKLEASQKSPAEGYHSREKTTRKQRKQW